MHIAVVSSASLPEEEGDTRDGGSAPPVGGLVEALPGALTLAITTTPGAGAASIGWSRSRLRSGTRNRRRGRHAQQRAATAGTAGRPVADL